MSSHVLVVMKSGNEHKLQYHTHVQESFTELVGDIITNEKFYITGDIVLNVNEIESMEEISD